jgi:hypothetical protein
MTRQRFNQLSWWLGTVIAVLSLFSFVWSGATRIKGVEDKCLNGQERLDRLEVSIEKRLERIENKIDYMVKE